MDTKIGEEREGVQTYLSPPFWRAGFVMRAVYNVEVETADEFETKDVLGCVVHTGTVHGWLPDAALLEEMVERYDDLGWRAEAERLSMEDALAKALGR